MGYLDYFIKNLTTLTESKTSFSTVVPNLLFGILKTYQYYDLNP